MMKDIACGTERKVSKKLLELENRFGEQINQ